MAVFREYTPKRRNITRNVSSHQEHSEDLKTDFKKRCGYCDDIKFGNAVFEIDHFVPQNPRCFTTSISPTDYSNLVYSCMSCNRSKSNKWPTNDEKIHNNNDEGFIDPCNEEYIHQFEREDSGRILPTTKLGEWMYTALKLHKPQHEILWNIERLDKIKKEILETLNSNQIDPEIIKKLRTVYAGYDEYLDKLTAV